MPVCVFYSRHPEAKQLFQHFIIGAPECKPLRESPARSPDPGGRHKGSERPSHAFRALPAPGTDRPVTRLYSHFPQGLRALQFRPT